jgi:hypothetical protein
VEPPVGLDGLIQEQQERWAPYTDTFADLTPAATHAWYRHVGAMIEERQKRWRRTAEYERKGMHDLKERLGSDERFGKGLDLFRRAMDTPHFEVEGRAGPDSARVQRFAVRPMTDDPFLTRIFPLEETLDVFGLPYAAHSSSLEGGPHFQHHVTADKTSGRFGFLHQINEEGGESYAAAALWIHFMRRTPGSPPGQGSPGLAQIRPYIPYSYLWIDKSYIATAHNIGGFGIFVTSRDLSGGDERTDQNHRYWIFSDGTSWFEEHANPAFPGFDQDHALSFNDAAPHFSILPNRLYSAAVWCFGLCDANGTGADGASFAAAQIDARMPFVVVAQTRN